METYGHDFARLRQAFVAVPAAPAVLRRRGAVRRRPARARDHAARHQAGAHLRHRRRTRRCAPRTSCTTPGACASASRRDGKSRRSRSRSTCPGDHNVLNALAAIAVGTRARRARGGDRQGARRVQRRRPALPALRRRRARRAAARFTLVDDYGHHPAEMAATLAAARGAFPGRRLVLAFQPHRYTRTRDLFEDFVTRALDRRRAGAGRGLCGRRGADRRRRRPLAGARACASPARSSRCSSRRSPSMPAAIRRVAARRRRGGHDGRGLDRQRAGAAAT